jgi:hypothetical protein
MYFGAELIDARAALGLEPVPIGLIQSSVGGTQIESWMPNASLTECTDLESNAGLSQLYHAMVAPFANFSVAGWLWYVSPRRPRHTTKRAQIKGCCQS